MFGLKLCWLLMTLGMTGLFLYTGSGFALSLAVCLAALVLCAIPVNLVVRNKLRVTMELPMNLRKGESGIALLLVENPTIFPVLRICCRICAENRLNGQQQELTVMTYALPRKASRIELQLGDIHCGRLHVTTRKIQLLDCFGLIPVSCSQAEGKSVTVQPHTFEQQIHILPNANHSDDSEVYAEDRPGSDLTETFQIREYAEGDSPRQIHWKLTGKFDRLIVRDPSLPVTRSVLVFWERTGDSGDADNIDAQAEAVVTICRTLLNQSVQFVVGWNETDTQHCVLQPIHDLEELIGLLPRLLRARGQKDGIGGAELLVQALGDQVYSHVIYVAETPQPAVLELQKLGHVTMLLCGETGEGITFDPVHYEEQLAELEV